MLGEVPQGAHVWSNGCFITVILMNLSLVKNLRAMGSTFTLVEKSGCHPNIRSALQNASMNNP